MNHELGVDRPIYEQYWTGSAASHAATSASRCSSRCPSATSSCPRSRTRSSSPASPSSWSSRSASSAGRSRRSRRNRLADRVITIVGLSLTSIPEFVTAIVLIVVFGLQLGWLPVTGTARRGRGVARRRSSTCCCRRWRSSLVLFGYIARITRAGTIEALDSDYTRTAYLKGLAAPRRDPPPRAAQRAAADDRRRRDADRLPDRRARGRSRSSSTTTASAADLRGRAEQGLPDAAEPACSMVGVVVPRRDAARRHRSTRCSTRASARERRVSVAVRQHAPARDPDRRARRAARVARRSRQLAAVADVPRSALVIVGVLGRSARSSAALIAPHDPFRRPDSVRRHLSRLERRPLVRHRPARPRRLLARASPARATSSGRAARDAARHRRSAPSSAS